MIVEISRAQFMPPRGDSDDHREDCEEHQFQFSYQVVDVQSSRNEMTSACNSERKNTIEMFFTQIQYID